MILAVDAIQSAGALRLDLSRLPVDYLAAGSYKWLLGPQGIGFAWCHPDLLPQITPALVGTASVQDRLNYFSYPTDRVDFETTARRLEEGNPSLLDMAAFAASYTKYRGHAATPWMEEMLTIDPRREGSIRRTAMAQPNITPCCSTRSPSSM